MEIVDADADSCSVSATRPIALYEVSIIDADVSLNDGGVDDSVT